MKDHINLIARKIKEGGKNVVFTGAGISTESGIPDYRSQGGIWDKFRPVYFDEFMSSREAREEYWQSWTTLYQGLMKAEPNPAHAALVKLHRMGLLESVITQNIRFNVFGYYPYEEQWRPLLAMIILVGMLFYSRDWNRWGKKLGYAWLVALFVMGTLMKGGLFGLVPVESTKCPNLLDRAMRMFPRMRAWMFSSVTSGCRPSNAGARVSR